MGIRLFNSKETLQEILEEFEVADSDDADSNYEVDSNAPNAGSSILISQLRYFVIQVCRTYAHL